jgi:hypothetical protein
MIANKKVQMHANVNVGMPAGQVDAVTVTVVVRKWNAGYIVTMCLLCYS